jgi:hypothetical protein
MHTCPKKPVSSVVEIVFDAMDYSMNVSAIGRG